MCWYGVEVDVESWKQVTHFIHKRKGGEGTPPQITPPNIQAYSDATDRFFPSLPCFFWGVQESKEHLAYTVVCVHEEKELGT